MKTIIRPETEKDFAEIYNVVKKSFENAEHTDGDEQNLVNRLRAGECFVPGLSLVAEQDGKIVGHIMFTTAKLGVYRVLTLAPVAVLPEYQGTGIGAMLINRGHQIAREMGFDYITLVGHKTYYPRFGYRPADTIGVKSPMDLPPDVFMVYDINNKNQVLNETLKYPPEFFIK